MRSWLRPIRPRTLALLAVSATVVVTVASRVPALGGGEIDWDEGVYWLSMRSMQAGHALFTSVYSSQPPAFLLFTEPPWALLGGGIAAARAVMLAWAAIAVVAGSVIGWRLGGPLAAVVAAVTLAVDPLMVQQSVVLQADGPATALGLVAVGFAALGINSSGGRWSTAAAVLAGAALAVGVLTKLLDVAALLPLLAALWVRGRPRLLVAAGGGGVLAAAAILLPLHTAWGAMWSQSVGLHLDTQSATSGISVATALQIRWPLAAIAGLGALLGWRRHPRLVVVGVAWFVGGMVAMAMTHPLWPHHVVVLSPALALLSAAGASATFAWLRGIGRPGRRAAATAALALALCAAAALFLTAGLQRLQPAINFSALAGVLRAHTAAGAEVVGDDQFAQALADRAAPPGFVDTSNTRMYAERGSVTGLEAVANGAPPVCAVLFSSGRLVRLPGFAAWVTARYPVSISLGGSRSLAVAPGCS